MVLNLAGIFWLLVDSALDPIICGLSVAHIVFAAALWNWKKWGAYGLGVCFGLTFLLGLAIVDLYTVASSVIPMVIMAFLVQPKWHFME